MYSLYRDKPRLHYFIGGTCELSLYWIIPGSNCVNTKETTKEIHVVPTGTYPVYKYANQIGFGLQTFGAYCLHIPKTIPIHKLNTVIKYKFVS